jgi:hypothetical protein
VAEREVLVATIRRPGLRRSTRNRAAQPPPGPSTHDRLANDRELVDELVKTFADLRAYEITATAIHEPDEADGSWGRLLVVGETIDRDAHLVQTFVMRAVTAVADASDRPPAQP